MGLALPNHPNNDKLDATTNLPIHYAKILSTISSKMYTDHWTAPDPNHHSIAQALEADIDAEIACMATEGILKSCSHPQSF